MDNLITIHEGDFPVDARELHEFLEVMAVAPPRRLRRGG
jgi:hypothetical protein